MLSRIANVFKRKATPVPEALPQPPVIQEIVGKSRYFIFMFKADNGQTEAYGQQPINTVTGHFPPLVLVIECIQRKLPESLRSNISITFFHEFESEADYDSWQHLPLEAVTHGSRSGTRPH